MKKKYVTIFLVAGLQISPLFLSSYAIGDFRLMALYFAKTRGSQGTLEQQKVQSSKTNKRSPSLQGASHARRNPFSPFRKKERRKKQVKKLAGHHRKNKTYRLQGIFWSSEKKAAILNDQVIVPGRRYGTFEVLEISPQRVTIRLLKSEKILIINWPGQP